MSVCKIIRNEVVNFMSEHTQRFVTHRPPPSTDFGERYFITPVKDYSTAETLADATRMVLEMQPPEVSAYPKSLQWEIAEDIAQLIFSPGSSIGAAYSDWNREQQEASYAAGKAWMNKEFGDGGAVQSRKIEDSYSTDLPTRYVGSNSSQGQTFKNLGRM